MVLSIEQGVVPPNGPSVAFEDDVLVRPGTSGGAEASASNRLPRKDTLPDEPARTLEAVLDPYQRSHIVAETGVVQLEQ